MSTEATGKVTLIYPNQSGCYIQLNGNGRPVTKSNYFQLKLNHPNYNSIYSLAILAFSNKTNFTIRTVLDLDINTIPEIQYVKIF